MDVDVRRLVGGRFVIVAVEAFRESRGTRCFSLGRRIDAIICEWRRPCVPSTKMD